MGSDLDLVGDREPLRNWAGNHRYRAARVVTPSSVEELREIVTTADRVRALGSRHSFNRICDTSGVLIDTRALVTGPILDEERGSMTVSPGVTFGAVAQALDGTRWALPNLGSLPHISVIGAVSTGTHGSGTGNQVLAASVTRMRLMLADGFTVDVRRGDDTFEGCVVSVGALGVVLEVDLQLVPTFDVVQTLDDAGAWEHAYLAVPEVLSSAYSVSVFTRWGRGATEILAKHRVESAADHVSPSTKETSMLLVDGPNLTARDARVSWSAGLPHFRMEFEPSFGEEIQSEFFVSSGDTVEALAAVTALADVLDPHLIVSEIRAIASDSLWLSPAYGRDSTSLHFTWKLEPEPVERVNALVAEALAPLAARPHWGKRFPGGTALRDSYPRAASFLSLAQDLDPTRKFTNDFIDETLGSAPATDG
ncbi:MAG: FAD-binding protein [Nocardioides sp.]